MTYTVPTFSDADEMPCNPILDYAPPTTVQMIYDYIYEHPKCTRAEIAAHVGLATSTLNSYLSGLRYAGRIKRHRDLTNRKNGVRWEVGREEGANKDEDMKIGVPRQRTVTEWEPLKITDPIIDFLFGRQI